MVFCDFSLKLTQRLLLRKLEGKLNQQINEYKHFEQILLQTWNTHAPIKSKFLRANHIPHMAKVLTKAIIKKIRT